jgi:EAL domain-containing protein (putative c-di-GMP-specific phosphodiesterase class I)
MNDVAEITRPMTERRRRVDRRRPAGPEQAAEIVAAIENGAIEVLFQPQFLCGDDSLAGAEALVRWQHPEQGILSGDRVFALAHDAGVADRLARHAAESAMAVAAQWPEDLRLALNATADDLADPRYPGMLTECLRTTGLPASRVTLEITEQALVDELDGAARILGALTDCGIAIALDDFGAGFCNFRYLKVLPLAALKLDRSMVEGIATDRRDLAVLRAIMAMARALDLLVIAEGIETRAQHAAVRREGCDRWQGFLGAAPMTAAEFAALVAR